MHTPADVAAKLGLPIKTLRWLAFHTEVATRTHYIKFEVPKRSGGTRILSAPAQALKAAQRWILANILNRLPPTDAAHGFVPERGIVSNANPHVGKAVRREPRPARTSSRPSPSHASAPCSSGTDTPAAVATILALLCTECPRMTATYAGHEVRGRDRARAGCRRARRPARRSRTRWRGSSTSGCSASRRSSA